MNLLAQPPLRSNAKTIADEQHPDHQLWVNRGPAGLAVKWAEMCADAGQVDEPINGPHEVAGRDVPPETKLVEQRLLDYRPFAHHQRVFHPKDD